MLKIVIPGQELFDEHTSEFVQAPGFVLELEHSLVSLSKWEAKYEKAFLGPREKTPEEVFGYVKAMCLTPDVPDEVFSRVTQAQFDEITKYIDSNMSATHISDLPGAPKSREVITNELIYHWMFALDVPIECQNWHLNRLFTQLKVINAKTQPPKKLTAEQRAQMARRNSELNERRLKELNTTG